MKYNSNSSRNIHLVNQNNGSTGIVYSIKRFFSIIGFCCCFLCTFEDDDGGGDRGRRRGRRSNSNNDNEMREPMTKIRLGFNGKDTWINAEGTNFHQTFGIYSVLLDEDDQVIPLTKNGELFEPLDTSKKYKIVANRYGTSDSKWKILKQKEKENIKNYSSLKKQKKQKQKEFLKEFNNQNNNNNNNIQNFELQKQQPTQQETHQHQQQINNYNDNDNNNNFYPIQVEIVNNNVLIPNQNDNNNNNLIINNIKKDIQIDNKFFT